MIKRSLLTLLAVIVLLAVVLAVNTARQGSRQVKAQAVPPLAIDASVVAESLAAAVRAKTVSSSGDPAGSAAAFKALHAHIEARYPKVHAALTREVVGGFSLLYTWIGSNPSLKPVALLAHQDVVPISPGTESLWQKPPFAGVVDGGYVWGRGTLDDKVNIITQLEAVERLVAEGFKPKRTLILVFGHDEELGGAEGAAKVVALLKQRGVRLGWVMDEGGLITDGIFPGLKPPLALINIAEKGIHTLKLTAKAPPGHSSMPPPQPGSSAVGMVAQAVVRVDANPLPGGIHGVAAQMFETVAPELPLALRLPMSNLWLFRPMLESMLSKSASTNAMLRTTTALTMLTAGNKVNVLPGEASAVVNFRLLPGDTSGWVTEQVVRTISDARVDVKPIDFASEASAVSSTSSADYALIERTVREVFPEVVVAPGLMVAGTDSRLFEPVADNIYRFMPIRFGADDLQRLHGTDERIAIDQLPNMVRFYHRLIEQATR